MTNNHINTRNATLVQQGRNLFFTSWSEGTTSLGFPAFPFPANQGLRFQLYDSMSLDKPRTLGLTLNLSVTALSVPVTLGYAYVAIQELANTAAFEDTTPNLPSRLDGGTIEDGWLMFGTDDGTGWSNPITPATISIPLGSTITDPVSGATMYDYTSLAYMLEDANAGGIINLSVHIYTGANYIIMTPTLSMSELDFFTGIDGHGVERGRPVRDMRTGFPTHAADLVEDGYRPGIWTTPAQYDPADPRDERPVQLPSNEGTWEDDTPAS